jgi:hypothetical protein
MHAIANGIHEMATSVHIALRWHALALAIMALVWLWLRCAGWLWG